MNQTKMLPMLLALCAGLLLVGCEAFDRGPAPRSETAGTVSTTPPPAGRTIADRTRPPASPPERPARKPPAERPPARRLPASVDRPGYAVTRMALPSGERYGSAVFIEMSAPKEVLAGQEFDHKITLTNLTKKTLSGVVLTETLPKNLKASGTAPQATIAGQVLKWDIGKLGPEQSKSFTIRGAATSTGSVVPCCQVTYKIPEVCVAIRAVQPALKIVKTAPAEVIQCDPIPIKIVVTNTGTGMAQNVKVTDPLPAGMKTLAGKSAILFEAGTLAPGQSRAFTVQAKASKTGQFVNKATAVADGGLRAESEAVTTVVRLPVLAVTKVGPQFRYVGRPLTYTMTVTNKGDAEARDTVLVDTLPRNAKFVKASAGGQVAAGKVTWKLGSLAPKASKTVSLSLLPGEPGTIRNAVVATAYCAKGSASAVTEVKGIPAILLECVDLEDPIEVGTKTTYVITVTNQGSAVGTNIAVKCTLPKEQQFVSAVAPAKETVVGQTVTFAPLKSLAPKAKATYRVVVKGVAAGDVRFKASLTSDQMTSPAEETESTHVYE